jgi:hypothetical protein
LNIAAGRRSKNELLHGSRHESQRIQSLEEENIFLRKSLEDHQDTLELIMKKYREQVLDLMAVNRIDNSCLSLMNQGEETEAKTQKICEMAAIMQKAIDLDAKSSEMEQELIATLRYENAGLRELLGISSSLILNNEEAEDEDEKEEMSMKLPEFQSYELQHIPPDLDKKEDELKDDELFDGLANGSQQFAVPSEGAPLKRVGGYK